LQPLRRPPRAEHPRSRLIDQGFDAPLQLAAALGNPGHDSLIEGLAQLADGRRGRPAHVERERAEVAAVAAAAAAEAARAAEEAAASATAEPPLTPEQLAALRDEAETLLARVINQKTRLERPKPAGWAPEGWPRDLARERTGDDALLADEYRTSLDTYAAALALGEALLGASADIVARALDAGRAAFAAGDAVGAIARYDAVLAIDAEHEVAMRERADAERLPEVLALVTQGDTARAAGDLDAAGRHYREALELLPEWPAAQAALRSLSAAIVARDFDRAMSRGSSALAEEDYGDAAEHFTAALALRPGAEAARDGLLQAEQGQRMDEIELAEARAFAFEAREIWDRAIAQYRAALETDATLTFAKEGLERAEARASLDAKLVHLLDNPDLLLTDSLLADARRLLETARAQDTAGPRLTGQIERLENLVELATTPLPVRLRSDGQTEVTVYRVGPLGTFATHELELRPGTYTAVGSRHGYRDVRETFTVLPGSELAPVAVICMEPI
jgi:tetratricopeptide (TPR) repeat protein